MLSNPNYLLGPTHLQSQKKHHLLPRQWWLGPLLTTKWIQYFYWVHYNRVNKPTRIIFHKDVLKIEAPWNVVGHAFKFVEIWHMVWMLNLKKRNTKKTTFVESRKNMPKKNIRRILYLLNKRTKFINIITKKIKAKNNGNNLTCVNDTNANIWYR